MNPYTSHKKDIDFTFIWPPKYDKKILWLIIDLTPLQNLLKPVHKYGQSKTKMVQDVDKGLSFLLRGRDLLCVT